LANPSQTAATLFITDTSQTKKCLNNYCSHAIPLFTFLLSSALTETKGFWSLECVS